MGFHRYQYQQKGPAEQGPSSTETLRHTWSARVLRPEGRRELVRRLVSRRVERRVRTEDTSLDLTAFESCLKESGIEAPKVDMDRHGAIGRFRMCAGFDAPASRVEKSATSSLAARNRDAQREEALKKIEGG